MREMKNSGIEWIGDIPNNYGVQRIKNCIKERFGGCWGEDETENNSHLCIRIADFDFNTQSVKDTASTMRSYTATQLTNGLLEDGDIIIEKSGGGEKTPVGRTVIYSFDKHPNAMFANFCDVLRPSRKINNKYMAYCLKALYQNVDMHLYFNQTTGLQNLNMGKYLNAKIPLPDFNEQVAIVVFLDSKCAEIDSLTTDIQSQIDTLEQYKKSLVFNTVKSGINNSEMKDTDSDVWDKIPSSWELKDIKYLFEIVKRIAGKEGYDVLSVTQRGLAIKDLTSGDGQLANDYSGYQFVYPTDYVMNHMDLLTGWVDLSDKFGVTSPDYRVFRLRDKENNSLDYYKHIMQCCYMNRIFYSLGQGVSNLGRWRLQTSSFNNFKVPVPPLDEQKEIANYLNEQISEINDIIDLKRAQIATIAEYKKSLIYEYVTGKKEL